MWLLCYWLGKRVYIFLSIKGATIDNAMGVLYSFNDNIPKVEDAVELKKLDKPNWYFYYSNWKILKSEIFLLDKLLLW